MLEFCVGSKCLWKSFFFLSHLYVYSMCAGLPSGCEWVMSDFIFFFLFTGSYCDSRYFWKSSANTHTDIQVKKERPCTMYMWVYVHVTVCRCVGFRLSCARRGSAMGYVISLVWYPFGLATLSQMTWWQSCKANKETSATNQSFFSTTGAKNMTKSNNGVVWKQCARESFLSLNLKWEPVFPHCRTAMTLGQVQTAPPLYLYPWFLQLWRWS